MIRLLKIDTLELKEFHEDNTPAYAIASHRWQKDEAVFKDVLKRRNQNTSGFAKIRGFCDLIRSWHNPFNLHDVWWLWIDTCCIDKRSSAELSEAINSMYNWYAEAEICIVYLFDVEVHQDSTEFESSEWFDRGWTLQELIAPSTVMFFDKNWKPIGHKSGVGQNTYDLPLHRLGIQMNGRIARRTGIPERILDDPDEIDNLDVETRLSWMNKRYTTKIEDQAYCLLGIFNIHIPLIYGEREQAKRRLLDEILRRYVWKAQGAKESGGKTSHIPSETADSTQTSLSDLSHTMQILQDRILRLETEHSNIQRERTAGRRARRATRTADTFNSMLNEFTLLQEQTLRENLKKEGASNLKYQFTSLLGGSRRTGRDATT